MAQILEPKREIETFLKAELGRGEHRLVFIDGIYSKQYSNVSLVVKEAGAAREAHRMSVELELIVGEGGHLNLLTLQEDPSVEQFFTRRITLQKNAVLECASFVLGGAWLREDTHVRFDGEGASASLKGLGILRGAEQLFQQVTAEHAAGHCDSNQFFKNVLAENAKSDFDSLVHVHAGAQQSNSRQLSKNVLLSERAQAHARPQLRILADDVSCAHGATVGQLEKEELFYLRSRGLSAETARLLLINGFAQEIVDGISDAHSRVWIGEKVRRRLEEIIRANAS